jgi:hypothetical protein
VHRRVENLECGSSYCLRPRGACAFEGTKLHTELEVLGHIINSAGTTPAPHHIQVIIEYPPPRTRNSSSPSWGWSTSTAISHQVLQQSRSCSPAPSKEVKRNSNGHLPWTVHFSTLSRYSARQCHRHTPHQTQLTPWRQMPSTPTLAAPSTNRYEALGSHWVSFLASYNLQNRNNQRLTGSSPPPLPPSDISGKSWKEMISSSG